MYILPSNQICNTWRVQKQFAHQWLMPYEAVADAIYVLGRRSKAVYMDSGREWFVLVMVSTIQFSTSTKHMVPWSKSECFFEQFAQWFIWCRAVNPGADD